MITVAPQPQRLTTQEAADFLGISRPTLVKLLDQDKIPYDQPGRHRRRVLDVQPKPAALVRLLQGVSGRIRENCHDPAGLDRGHATSRLRSLTHAKRGLLGAYAFHFGAYGATS